VDSVRKITTPTPTGDSFSMCICSDGSYGTPKGLIASFPVRSDGTTVEVVQGLQLNDFSREKINASIAELEAEREAVKDLL
jgi:malate dehydrogenase